MFEDIYTSTNVGFTKVWLRELMDAQGFCVCISCVNEAHADSMERGAVIDEVRTTFPELLPFRHVGVRYALGPARHDGHLRG